MRKMLMMGCQMLMMLQALSELQMTQERSLLSWQMQMRSVGRPQWARLPV